MKGGGRGAKWLREEQDECKDLPSDSCYSAVPLDYTFTIFGAVTAVDILGATAAQSGNNE